MYTIEIPKLDEFEADHISGIFNEYKCKILERRLKAVARKEENTVAWYDQHLAWHEEIMKKVKHTKETN